MKRLHIAVILLLIAVSTPLLADERTEPIDVIIALDKSLSMVEEIDAVKKYVNAHVIEDLLIPGDFFLVVAFYGETIVPVSTTIGGPEDKERAKEMISALAADGRFTDIGNALDVLGEQIERHSRPRGIGPGTIQPELDFLDHLKTIHRQVAEELEKHLQAVAAGAVPILVSGYQHRAIVQKGIALPQVILVGPVVEIGKRPGRTAGVERVDRRIAVAVFQHQGLAGRRDSIERGDPRFVLKVFA